MDKYHRNHTTLFHRHLDLTLRDEIHTEKDERKNKKQLCWDGRISFLKSEWKLVENIPVNRVSGINLVNLKIILHYESQNKTRNKNPNICSYVEVNVVMET